MRRTLVAAILGTALLVAHPAALAAGRPDMPPAAHRPAGHAGHRAAARTAERRKPAAASVPLTAVAGWAGVSGYFNVRAAPRSDAAVVGTLRPGERLSVLGAVQGGSVDGIDLWYHVRVGLRDGYVLSTGVASLNATGPWTGVISTNGEADVDYVYSLIAPSATASSDASFAPGTRMTVLGAVQGAALEGTNGVWYRVATGDYRPAYVYSAYLKFVQPGTGPIPVPLIGAAEALAVDLDTLRPLYARNATTPRAPASLAKLMTVAVVLDHLNLNARITVPAGAPSVGAEVGGTAMGLVPGEQLPVHDLLWGMLLPSGNDAAYTLAQAVAGSQSAFAALMNAKAAALGLTGTHYVQAYGLDAPNQYTTAWDLARLARYDLSRSPFFDQVVGTMEHTVGVGPGHPAFVLHNTNKLLGVYPGAFGVKTGTTPAAGENLVGAVRRNGHRILVVIMGATDRYADATALLNYATAVDR